MSIDGSFAIKLIGLPVLREHNDRSMGTVIDAGAGEDAIITWLCFKQGWIAEEYFLRPGEFRLEQDAVISLRPRARLEKAPSERTEGLVGVTARSHDGEVQGKIANILAEPVSLNIVGLELSNGLVRDWTRGRPLVVLELDDGLGPRHDRGITLPEDARTVMPGRLNLTGGNDALLGGDGPEISVSVTHPMDWNAIHDLSEEEIRQRMAEVVWQRRGAPQNPGVETLVDVVAPWAAALKQAAETGERDRFDDLAVLSSDEVEALRIFRVGAEPIERGAPSNVPEKSCVPVS